MEDAPDKGVALKKTLGVLVVELEQLTGSTTDLGEGQGDSPDLALVAQAVLAGELELSIKTGSLERTSGDLVGLGLFSTPLCVSCLETSWGNICLRATRT